MLWQVCREHKFSQFMKRKGLKKWFSDLMSYVVFIGFVAVVGMGGYFVYQHYQTKQEVTGAGPSTPPVESPPAGPSAASPAPGSPSALLRRPMEESLPPVMADLDTGVLELPATFRQAAAVVQTNASRPSTMQPAWQIAARLCMEINHTYAQRNQMAKNLHSVRTTSGPSSTRRSSAEAKFVQEKDEFFRRGADARWRDAAVIQRKRIETLYGQLLAAEEQAKRR